MVSNDQQEIFVRVKGGVLGRSKSHWFYHYFCQSCGAHGWRQYKSPPPRTCVTCNRNKQRKIMRAKMAKEGRDNGFG